MSKGIGKFFRENGDLIFFGSLFGGLAIFFICIIFNAIDNQNKSEENDRRRAKTFEPFTGEMCSELCNSGGMKVRNYIPGYVYSYDWNHMCPRGRIDYSYCSTGYSVACSCVP